MFKFRQELDFPDTKLDVVTVGEVLVDIISSNLVPSFKEAENFTRHFGGSPANIAMNTSKLGAESALISKIGDDGLGGFLLQKLNQQDVDTRGVVVDPNYNTSIVLVTQSKKSPAFLAYRDAEKNISGEDIHQAKQIIKEAKIIHLSTFALSAPQTRKAMVELVKFADEQDKIISLDPNYRPELWEGQEKGPPFIKNLLKKVNIAKPSLDDAKSLFGSGTPGEYIELFHQAGVDFVILTLGAGGVIISTREEKMKLDSFATEVVDTTGAGDAFWSGLYTSLVDKDKLEVAVKVGNATAGLALQEVGALADLPRKEEIIENFQLKKEE